MVNIVITNGIETLDLQNLNISDKDKKFLKDVLKSLNEEDLENGDYYRKVCENIDRDKSSLRKRLKKIINEIGTCESSVMYNSINSKTIKGKEFIKLLLKTLKSRSVEHE